MYKLYILLCVCLFSLKAVAEDSDIERIFTQQRIEGTIVIASLEGDRIFVHNDIRAGRKMSPASTFKILNTLIALEEKVIDEKEGILKWDGKPYEIPAWNRDHTLESAFKASCVWCYQELARRIGAENYRHYLSKAAYGHLAENFDSTNFWLDGSLEISALEQVAFLRKLYLRTLVFNASSYETLREFMRVEATPAFAIYAKTGWSARSEPQIGWYAGYLETADEVWLFASNIDIVDPADLPLRQQLTLEAFKAKGIIH